MEATIPKRSLSSNTRKPFFCQKRNTSVCPRSQEYQLQMDICAFYANNTVAVIAVFHQIREDASAIEYKNRRLVELTTYSQKMKTA